MYALNLLYCGKISKDKGIFELVAKLKKERNHGTNNYNLLIAGGGSQGEINRLKTKIEGMSNIHYVGCIQMSQYIYSKFDLGITPSWRIRESLGLSGLEQAAYIGRSLLASKSECYEHLYANPGFYKYHMNDNIYSQIDSAIKQSTTSPDEVIKATTRGCDDIAEIVDYVSNKIYSQSLQAEE